MPQSAVRSSEVPALFAEVTSSEIGIFVGCLIVVLGLAVTIKWLIQRDPPLHREFVSFAAFEKSENAIREELSRQAFSRKGIYDRIDEQGQAVASMQSDIATLKTDTASQNEDLSDLKKQINETDRRIDAIPGRTIALLRDTQQLHFTAK